MIFALAPMILSAVILTTLISILIFTDLFLFISPGTIRALANTLVIVDIEARAWEDTELMTFAFVRLVG